MQQRPKITPEEKQRIIQLFNEMPEDEPSRYATIAKKLNRSISAVFTIVKASEKKESKIKYFNPKIFPF